MIHCGCLLLSSFKAKLKKKISFLSFVNVLAVSSSSSNPKMYVSSQITKKGGDKILLSYMDCGCVRFCFSQAMLTIAFCHLSQFPNFLVSNLKTDNSRMSCR